MPLTEARVKATKYHPEKLPDSWHGAVPNLAEVTPPIVDLKRFSPYIIALSNIGLTPNPLAELRAGYDKTNVAANTAPMIISTIAGTEVGSWHLPAKDVLSFTFYGLAGIASYAAHYGLWVIKPTVADKLLYGVALTPEEEILAGNKKDKGPRALGIRNSVEKGVLPIPIPLQIAREYAVMGEETHTATVNIAVAATPYTLESLYPRPNEFLVLTRLAAAPGTAAQNVRIVIDRDGDGAIAEVATFPLSTITGGEIGCFLPAMREMRLTAIATVAPGLHAFRYTIQRIKLTNTLRLRFGLMDPEDAPGDLADKVAGGVL